MRQSHVSHERSISALPNFSATTFVRLLEVAKAGVALKLSFSVLPRTTSVRVSIPVTIFVHDPSNERDQDGRTIAGIVHGFS